MPTPEGLPTTLPGRSPSAHVHCVGPGAYESLNTQDQARRLMAETSPHLEDMIIGFDLHVLTLSFPIRSFYTSHDDYKLDRNEGVASNVCSTAWDLRPLPHWMVIFMWLSRAGKRASMALVGSH